MNQRGSILLSMVIIILMLSIALYFIVRKDDMVLKENSNEVDIAKKIAVESYISNYVRAVELNLTEKTPYQEAPLVGKYSVLDLDVPVYVNKPSEGIFCIDESGIVTHGSFKLDDYIIHYEDSKTTIIDLDEIEDIICQK